MNGSKEFMKEKKELFDNLEQQNAKLWDPFYNEATYKDE